MLFFICWDVSKTVPRVIKGGVTKHVLKCCCDLPARSELTIECILKAQVPGVSMRPPLCTDADDLLRCSATVGNLGERGEPDILT